MGGDEVLAAALRRLVAREDVELVNLGQALERLPVEWEVEVAEGSSWSCAHGVERWRADCGCQANGQPGWHQRWRAPLRDALDGLRDQLAAIFERELGSLVGDPWGARDRFIELVLDPARRGAEAFLEREAGRRLDPQEVTRALRLLEMQRQALLMYTSCGWFFSELSGIETVQVLKYAARAIQLARAAAGTDLEGMLQDALARAPSNVARFGDGARVYEALVLPSVVSMERVAAHHAISIPFGGSRGAGTLSCYRYEALSRRRETSGPATLEVGRLRLEGLLTREQLDASYCVLHFGASDFRCGLRPFHDVAEQAALERELFARLDHLSLAELARAIDHAFTGRDYTLRDLFLDERRHMAGLLLGDTMERYERDYLQIFEANRRLMGFLREINSPIPTPLRVAADVGLTHELLEAAEAFEAGRTSLPKAHAELVRIVALAEGLGARLGLDEVRSIFERALTARLAELVRRGDGVAEVVELVDLAERVGATPELWPTQNLLWAWLATDGARLDRDGVARLGRRFWFDEAALVARSRRATEGAEAAPAEAAAT
jgi:hypothetical protein